MKTLKVAVILFAGLLLQKASSQTYPDATLPATNAPVAMAQTSTDAAPVETSTMADTNAAMTETNTTETSTDMANTAVSMAATNETASTEGAAATNATPALPPIVFQDVPLTTAIETLARLANINYLLDPDINYGQPDKNGNVKSEPTLSIRWENVTYQQALLALLDNYGLQMNENPKTKIYKISIRNPSAPPPLMTRVIQLKYASTSNMVEAISSTLTDKRSRVLPDNRTSQLVVVATEDEQADVDNLVNQLDRPTRQVLIETKIVEMSSNPRTVKGIDWSGTLAAQNVTFGNNVSQVGRYSHTVALGDTNLVNYGFSPVTETFGPPIPISSPALMLDTAKGFNPTTAFLDADGVKAVLSFLNSSSDAQVMSTPRIVTLDNETATISVTRAFPIFNTTAGTQGSPGGSQLTYSNLGTVVEVTPRISANDYIWLKVTPSVSSYFDTVTKIVGGVENQGDEFDMRTMDTQVLIPNSHTLVMGGLVKDDPSSQMTKVPFLGDIPILGLAFRHEDKSTEKDNLLLFITPTIVKDSDFQAASSKFLDSQPRTMKEPLDTKSMYDSAYPRGNWSDPLSDTVK